MIKLPNCIIKYIAEYLLPRDYLNLRAVCLKTKFLPLNNFNLKINSKLAPGKYNFIKYIGHNAKEDLKECIIRKLYIDSATTEFLIELNVESLYIKNYSNINFKKLNSLKVLKIKSHTPENLPPNLKKIKLRDLSLIMSRLLIAEGYNRPNMKVYFKYTTNTFLAEADVKNLNKIVGNKKRNVYRLPYNLNQIELAPDYKCLRILANSHAVKEVPQDLDKLIISYSNYIFIENVKIKKLVLNRCVVPKRLPDTLIELVLVSCIFSFAFFCPPNLKKIKFKKTVCNEKLSDSVKLIKSDYYIKEDLAPNARFVLY